MASTRMHPPQPFLTPCPQTEHKLSAERWTGTPASISSVCALQGVTCGVEVRGTGSINEVYSIFTTGCEEFSENTFALVTSACPCHSLAGSGAPETCPKCVAAPWRGPTYLGCALCTWCTGTSPQAGAGAPRNPATPARTPLPFGEWQTQPAGVPTEPHCALLSEMIAFLFRSIWLCCCFFNNIIICKCYLLW